MHKFLYTAAAVVAGILVYKKVVAPALGQPAAPNG